MGKDKLRKFNENLTFKNLLQPEFEEVFNTEHPIKGNWRKDFFKNDNPIVLELGCGRGEYTVALGSKFPEKNYIGVDIKGARIWRGAKTATELEMGNVGFLRTRIEFINAVFGPNEVDEIWITFPDPQLKKQRGNKRLTAPIFLSYYAKFLKPDAVIHLKTDSPFMHEYTKAVCECNNLTVEACCADIYGTGYADEILSVKTTYETKFLEEGHPITYLRFRLDGKSEFVQVPEEMLPDCER
ncbi:MAG: tRNA (guanosine(46)-N7)-methyltransferase TrmB [Tidjanibacter sp.]|nr:tRNA (guanosine(46)-N7)-methyltransferase TrmB [Tidjanibacter sp.]MBR6831402.1 tRNA (guanosine(46)-N7)-methyltransferase TrmB [Tidjanibacter sp.]